MPAQPDYPRGARRARLTLKALEKLVPLPRELAELRSDDVKRDAEHGDGIPQPLGADGSGARSKPYELFDVSELDKPCNDNRPVKLAELERVMSFELAKVTVNTHLPRELAELRDDLELLFPPELVGLSR